MAENFQQPIKSEVYNSRDWETSKLRCTHNEIERKRRARLKLETDFLREQLPQSLYRDKLAVFKAGTQQLLNYSAIGNIKSRNLILTDDEYSTCVLNNFDGFAMRIRCRDAEILTAQHSTKHSIWPNLVNCVGKSLYNLAAKNYLTETVIRDNLSISENDMKLLSLGQFIGRNFVIPLLLSTTSFNDNEECFFVEFCGDIIPPKTDQSTVNELFVLDNCILQVLCRIIETNHSTIKKSTNEKLFSLRLQPDTHLILEFSGRVLPVELPLKKFVGKCLLDFISPSFKSTTESKLQDAEKSGSVSFSTSFTNTVKNQSVNYVAVITRIILGEYLHYLVADFF